MVYNQYQSFVQKIPLDCVLLVRVAAEQVLDPEDYPVDKLIVKSGLVISQETIQEGVFHEVDDLRGMNTLQLSGWSAYENLMPSSPMEDILHEILVLEPEETNTKTV